MPPVSCYCTFFYTSLDQDFDAAPLRAALLVSYCSSRECARTHTAMRRRSSPATSVVPSAGRFKCILGVEVGRVGESPDGAAPVFNPSGGGTDLQPRSPRIRCVTSVPHSRSFLAGKPAPVLSHTCVLDLTPDCICKCNLEHTWHSLCERGGKIRDPWVWVRSHL
jgi:hypothetical protein